MDLKALSGKASFEKVPRGTIEKDYVLSVVLSELSKSTLKGGIIFKGGTAIKKVYFRDARFSEDLDFTVVGFTKEQLLDTLKGIFEDKEILGVNFKQIRVQKTSAGLRLSLKFVSLLGHPQSIRFDFSFRDNILLKPVEMEVFDDYSIGKSTIFVLVLEEIFAEKIQALLSRTVARDLYDTWYLLNKMVRLEKELVNKKFAYYKETFDKKKLEHKIRDFEPNWNQNLQQLLGKVPEQSKVAKETLQMLSL